MNHPPILLATRSAGKLRELRPLFAAAGLDLVDLDAAGIPPLAAEDDIECYDTFEENALAKARYFAARAPGKPVVAEDSGLEVLALDGAPGVLSKRWSGRTDLDGQALDDANNARLDRLLAQATDRRARYVCVAVFVRDGEEIVRRGETAGVIASEPRGSGGFGYDPYFVSDELGLTFGEVGRADKERVSHRGRAFRALISAIAESESRRPGGG